MAQPTLKKRLKKILKSPKLLLISAICIVLSTTLVFANKGLWRHAQLHHAISLQTDELTKLGQQEKSLASQVALLRTEDEPTIERVARERYNLKRPGEIIYRQAKK